VALAALASAGCKSELCQGSGNRFLLNLDFTTLDKPKVNSLTVVVRGAGFEKHRTYERRPDELTEAILAKGTTTVIVHVDEAPAGAVLTGEAVALDVSGAPLGTAKRLLEPVEAGACVLAELVISPLGPRLDRGVDGPLDRGVDRSLVLDLQGERRPDQSICSKVDGGPSGRCAWLSGFGSVYPDKTPGTTVCQDGQGQSQALTGPTAANWFNYGGCGNSKEYPLRGCSLIRVVATAECPGGGCVISQIDFTVEEHQGAKWAPTAPSKVENLDDCATHQPCDKARRVVNDYYPTPGATRVRVVAKGSASFYACVYEK